MSPDRAHLNSIGDRRLLLNKTKTIDALQCVELAIMRLLGLIAASEVDRHRKSLKCLPVQLVCLAATYIHRSWLVLCCGSLCFMDVCNFLINGAINN